MFSPEFIALVSWSVGYLQIENTNTTIVWGHGWQWNLPNEIIFIEHSLYFRHAVNAFLYISSYQDSLMYQEEPS
jgi:hypothetical protein